MENFWIEGPALDGNTSTLSWPFDQRTVKELNDFMGGVIGELSGVWYSRDTAGTYTQHSGGPTGEQDFPIFDDKGNEVESNGDMKMGDASNLSNIRGDIVAVCSQNAIQDLLNRLLDNPRDGAIANKLDKTMNGEIKEIQRKADDSSNLTMNVDSFRANFMEATLNAFLSERGHGEAKANAERVLRGKLDWLFQEITQKAFPPAWYNQVIEAVQKYVAKAEQVAPFHVDDVMKVHNGVKREYGGIFSGTAQKTPEILPVDSVERSTSAGGQEQPHSDGPVPAPAPNNIAPSQSSNFSDCIKPHSSTTHTFGGDKILGWRQSGNGNQVLIQISPEGRKPLICRFMPASKAEVETYRQTEQSVKIPTVDEVKTEDKNALRGRNATEVGYHTIATKHNPNDVPAYNPTFILFRVPGDTENQPLRMVWGSQFVALVTGNRSIAKAVIKSMYNLGMEQNAAGTSAAQTSAAQASAAQTNTPQTNTPQTSAPQTSAPQTSASSKNTSSPQSKG